MSQPQKIKAKKTVVIVPDDTTAKVTERIGNQTVSFDAKVEQQDVPIETDENADDQDNDNLDESFFDNQVEETFTPIPKSPVEILFERIAEIVAPNEILYANVTRTPDAMTDRFNVPCNTQMSLGAVQFSPHDLFNFVPNIQRQAGNTGGRFTVLVYKQDTQPLYYYRRMLRGDVDGNGAHLGASLYIPNPQPVETPNGNGNDQFSMLQVIRELNSESEARFNRLIEAMKPQESDIEKRLKEKMIDNLFNPPQRDENFSMEKTFGTIMQSAVVMQSFGDAFAKMLNRDPAPTPEKTWLDQAKEIMDVPIVQSLVERVSDIAEAAAVAKMQLPAGDPTAVQNPTEQHTNNEMETLITTIIDELESDRPLDGNNPVMIELSENYKDSAEMLQGFCQSLPFDAAVTTLGNMCGKMTPHPFAPFLDVEQTQAQRRYIWNERGQKAMVRLQEFFEYIKANPI